MGSERFSARDLRENSDLLFSRTQVEDAIAALAAVINRALENDEWLLLCVMNGGIAFTSQLMFHLAMPLKLDYVHASRYGRERFGGELKWLAQAQEKLDQRRVLIADDILDEGRTLKALTDWCWEQGVKDVKTAVMVQKDHPRSRAMERADFTALHVPDRFVFGYGMDLDGYGRNLPAIYAMLDGSSDANC